MINTSKMLEIAIMEARQLELGTKGVLTAEKLLIATLSLVTENQESSRDSELSNTARLIKQYFPLAADARSQLQQATKDTQANEAVQQTYINEIMRRAGREAEEGTQIRLDTVLSMIVNAPNENIKSCLDAQKAAPKQEEKKGLSWLSEQLSAFEGTDEKKEAAPKETDSPFSWIGAQVEAYDGKESEPAAPPAAPPEPDGDDGGDPISRLVKRVNAIRDSLLQTVFGQNHAIDVLTTGLFRGEYTALTDSERVRPKATFLFAGPSGVGKTYLAESAAKLLALPYTRFDMTEYSGKRIDDTLQRYVERNPQSVILFDELEKAHPEVIQTFLQVLDAGRLGGSKGVSFKDTILIFTTNAGRNLYEDYGTTDFSGVSRKVIMNALRTDTDRRGEAYFPPAICSRFDAGNVVMFNYIEAHNLRTIAKTEIEKQTENTRKALGLSIDVDENVYTALLFAEGGRADARTIRARAESFVNTELYELYRLLGRTDGTPAPTGIRVNAVVPEKDDAIRKLFKNEDVPRVLVFAAKEVCRRCTAQCLDVSFDGYTDIDAALESLYTNDYKLALIDFGYGAQTDTKYMNDEDTISVGRDFFLAIKEKFPEVPVYFLQTDEEFYDTEERISLFRRGIRDIVPLSTESMAFDAAMKTISENAHWQESMNELARAGKLVTYETGQYYAADGAAVVELFDFKLETAVDSEDAADILSDTSKPNVRFDDVIGAKDAKDELQYFVDFLKNPKKFLSSGVSAPKGILLYGPPGTGKTMLAKALAGESGVTFIAADGGSFLKQYVGESPASVHRLFAKARKYAPAVIFIDEIDAIAKKRTGSEFTHVEEQVLNALLTEMDGFHVDKKRPVFVLAATNFGVESESTGEGRGLDPAFLRRFDRRIKIDLPDQEERQQYLRLMTRDKLFSLSDTLYKNLAQRSVGMSLAQLASVIEMAKRAALRQRREAVDDEAFEDAFEEFKSGEEHTWSEESLLRTARHEAGHAFVCWKTGEKPSYITVVSRGDYGGYVLRDTEDNKGSYSKTDLLNSVRIALGGRAAELVYYGDIDGVTTGPSSDLQNATRTAAYMLCCYGMSKDFGMAVTNPYSRDGSLVPEIRSAVNALLEEELENAKQLIAENRALLDRFVAVLMEKTHLNGEEIDALFTAEEEDA
ncbi:MAG: AAA family ATPase [Eubacterium sp.]|nr:AAA family ATPase [Eubacterium sp.]